MNKILDIFNGGRERENMFVCDCVMYLHFYAYVWICKRERADFAWALDNSLIDNYRTKIKAFVVCSCAAKRKH